MNRFVKGMIIGSVLGITIGLIDYNSMPSIAKKYAKKGRKILKQMI